MLVTFTMARKKKRTATLKTTTARKTTPRKTTKTRKAAAKPRGRAKAAKPTKATETTSSGPGAKLKMNQIMLLKSRAKTTNNSLSVKVGAARFSLPIETTYLVGEDVAFCQVKGGSGIYKIDRNGKRFGGASVWEAC